MSMMFIAKLALRGKGDSSASRSVLVYDLNTLRSDMEYVMSETNIREVAICYRMTEIAGVHDDAH